MKKVLILIMGIVSSICLSAQNMPYILKYKVDKSKLNNYYYPVQEGDTTIYHNASNIDYLYINDREHSLRFKNYEREEIPISAIDTVYVYHDKFQCFENPQNWTDIIFSTEQIYFYKENASTGKPEALLMVTQNDTIPQGQYSYVSFNEEGQPKYMNVNGQHFFIERIYDNYYDAIVINSDSSFFYADSIRIQSNIGEKPSKVIMRSGYTQSNAQNAISLLNHFIGGVTMAEGGIAMLVGCSMLVPGANIAVGATIAIAGAATFIAGALTTARATDQLVSDGSHTQGFDVASNILGVGGIIGGPEITIGAQGIRIVEKTAARIYANIALNEGYTALQAILDANTDMYEAYARAKRIVEGRLTTGRAELFNIQSNAIMLYGNITRKMNVHDKVGIMISEDKNALTVKNCMYSENSETGEFTALFDELTPTQEYYYRAYYYATEFDTEYYNPYFVSSVKSFVMPGVKTLTYTPIGRFEYNVRGKVVWNNIRSSQHIVGICYSENNEIPTISDGHSEIEFANDGIFTIKLNLQGRLYYYRSYAYIDGEIVYGEPDILTNERLILEQFYYETNGDSWVNNENWCSDKPLNEWFGISMDGNFVNYINLVSNNLTGNGTLKGLKVLHDINIENNNLLSISISDCPNFQICHHWMTDNDKIILRSYNVSNCGKNAAYVDFYDIFKAAEQGYSCYYTHENWLGTIRCGRAEIDTIRIDEHYHRNQTIFSNLTAKYIECKNLRDFGRVFFEDVDCDIIHFNNCQFNAQGIGVEFDSNVNTLIIENCVIPSGRAGGNGLNNLIIRNSRIDDWWVIEAKSSITITNTIIEGHLVNISGTPDEVHDYIGKLL